MSASNVTNLTWCFEVNFGTWWVKHGRSQWPRGVRRRSAAARLLGLWVRIPRPLGHGYLSILSVMCCQLEVSATGWWRVRRSPNEWGASLCVIYKPQERAGHGPRWAAAPQEISKKIPEYVIDMTRRQVHDCHYMLRHSTSYCCTLLIISAYTRRFGK